ncbi:MAG: hypothetical protein ACRCUT_09375, partial [Spirochaetota bacterium]
MKIYRLLFSICIVCSLYSYASAQENSCLLLPYNAAPGLEQYASEITNSVRKNIPFPLLPETAVPEPYSFPDESAEQESIDAVAAIGSKNEADFVIAGRVTKSADYYYIDTVIISSDDRKIVYKTTLPVNGTDKDYLPYFDICGRLRLFTEQKVFPLTGLRVTQGGSLAGTTVSWTLVPD